MIKQLLVGLDGSVWGDSALRYGVDLAKLHKAQLIGLTVMDIDGLESAHRTPRPLGAGSADAELYKQHLQEARDRVKKLGDRFHEACEQHQVSGKLKSVEGRPADEILKASALSDLVILGRRTRFEYGLDEGACCAAGEEVLTHALRPLILAPEKHRAIKRVMIALDFHRLSDRIMFTYAHLNPYPGAEIHLVHAAASQKKHREISEEVIEYFKVHGIPVKPSLLFGDHAGQAIVNYAVTEKMDLVVMGLHTVSKVWAALVGSTGRYVLDNLELPIYAQT